MRREIASVAVMGMLLAASQLAALALAPVFYGAGFTAFQNPNDATNTLVYILMILVFTGVILALVRCRHHHLAKYVILGSVFLTVTFVILLPVYYGLYAGANLLTTPDADVVGNAATVLAFLIGALAMWALVKHPEWYVVDAIGFLTATGVTAILGISFGILPALLLLVALAAYDAWAVYRTRHMVTLADELTSQRLPVLLVVPKHKEYSFRQQRSLMEHIAKGEEREAMFIGLGDLIIPGVLAVSARAFLTDSFGRTLFGLDPSLLVALMTVVGSLAGFAVLMQFVMKGNPQAGLPLLNGGAIAGFFLGVFAVYGTVIPPTV